MTLKTTSQTGAFLNRTGGATRDLPLNADGNKPYPGGSLQVEVYAEDVQRDFVWRGLYKHAEAAGLPHEECVKFADDWATDKLLHQADGKTRAYTAAEFAQLKQKGATNFDLDERYSANVLTDLRGRQAAAAQKNAAPNPDAPSMSAPQYTEAEKAVKWLTDSIQTATGTESEIGKQFNRLAVSSLRLMGHLQEMQNKATETVSGAIREIAPDSVDEILHNSDRLNRENAQALKNANTIVTNNDRAEDLYLAKMGIKRPIAEDLHRKLMYFPEAIPNAVDSAVKGDFKDDDGSYSDKVGKIIGGLNPAGDARDVVANIKNVAEGKPSAWIGLGAAAVGIIPIIGDGGKVFLRAEKEVIAETVEKLVKQGVEKETAEKLAKEEVARLTREAEEKIAAENAARNAPKSGKLIIENGRTLSKFEREFADKMVAEGKTIKARAESNVIGEKNPDFEIDGEIVEFKYVSDLKGTTADKLSARLSGRILDGGSQASKVTLNVADQTGMTKEIAELGIKRAYGRLKQMGSTKMDEVRIYGKDFDITIVFNK